MGYKKFDYIYMALKVLVFKLGFDTKCSHTIHEMLKMFCLNIILHSKDLNLSGLAKNLFPQMCGFKSLEACCNWTICGIYGIIVSSAIVVPNLPKLPILHKLSFWIKKKYYVDFKMV